ncbi:MAG: GNAT family N-acetyltransferase [Chitinophagales bacterium]|nr:GNAT family N-acetyltransferase [Chitinophagales bacterium]
MPFVLKHFNELNCNELYELLQLREAVFQVEQNCIYEDIDGKDRFCWHLQYYIDDILVAYCRLVPENVSYQNYTSIGRVVSHKAYRKQGIGRALMQQALMEMETLFPTIPIKISAQQYLQKFYESLGFTTVGEGYLEDGIPHVAMVKTNK